MDCEKCWYYSDGKCIFFDENYNPVCNRADKMPCESEDDN